MDLWPFRYGIILQGSLEWRNSCALLYLRYLALGCCQFLFDPWIIFELLYWRPCFGSYGRLGIMHILKVRSTVHREWSFWLTLFLKQLGSTKTFMNSHFTGDLDCVWANMVVCQPFIWQWCLITWSKPVFLQFKLNMDASVHNGRAFGGGILCDHEGKYIFAFYKEFWEEGVLMAECLSLLHGL